MSTEASFLQAIREHPEDDLSRLVFADWLDEENQSHRAEFIRIQCELTMFEQTDTQWLTLKARSDELEAKHRRDWR